MAVVGLGGVMGSPNSPKVDSKEGIQMLADWARAHRFVLNQYHEDIARKHGVSFEGVMIAGSLNTFEPSDVI